MGHWTPDVAILHCPKPQINTQVIPSNRCLKGDEEVTIYGFVDAIQGLTHRKSHISNYVAIQDCWSVADGVHKGMSGGAVLHEGELVGVLHARHMEDKITAFFIPNNIIQQWQGDSFVSMLDTQQTPHINETEQQRAIDVFVGRQDELSLLKKHLSSSAGNPVAITALHGMAGVGKSWLADHYYATHKTQFPGGYFRLSLDAEAPASVELLLAELAELCELSVPQNAIAKHLKVRLNTPRTLIHIENVDTPEAVKSATQLCSQLSGCSIVLSGRIENLGKAQKHWQQVNLKPFKPEDGVAQLQAELEWLDAVMPEQSEAYQLVNTLGGLPLAVHLAAGYLAQGYSVAEFLDELKLTGYDLPPADASDDLLNRDEAKAVLDSTFNLSLKELAIQSARRKINDADKVFANLGMTSVSGFGLSIAESLLDLPTVNCRSLLRIAQSLSLIDLTQSQPSRWQLHPLFSAYLREQITDLSSVQERLNEWFLKRLPEQSTEPNESKKDQEHGWHDLNKEPTALAEWLMSLPKELQYTAERAGSQYASRNGPFIHWVLFCENALANREISDEQRSDILFTLMQVTHSSGNLDSAMSYAGQKYQLDTERNNTKGAAMAKGKIADILQARGNLDEALRIREHEELPVYEQLGEVLSIAITKGKISDILYLFGKHDEAFKIHEEGVLPLLKNLGDKRGLLVRQAHLAIQYFQSGQSLERAMVLLQEAYESAKEMQIPEAEQIKGIIEQVS
jgi:hypothetical protein